MPYAPGSFSKNFAWHGRGMHKLHEAVGNGFQFRLLATPRAEFRARCGVKDPNLELIPINFYLHNSVVDGENIVSVDELVFQAVTQPHTLHFDRLALFALHLNMAGDRVGQNGVRAPALWAKEFVVERLWHAGGWLSEQLEVATMDDFIFPLLDAENPVRTKCRSNYRHLYELCGYVPSSTRYINTGYEHWMTSAVFLALDRLCLENAAARRTNNFREFARWLVNQELYKLIGVPDETLDISVCRTLAADYIRLGGLDRFTRLRPPIRPLARTPGEVEVHRQQEREERDFAAAGAIPSAIQLLMQEEDERSQQVARRQQSRSAQVRSRRISMVLKHLYGHRCMFCDQALQIGADPDRYYSEGAHVQPLGEPHNGPDIAGNMLVLCPNHHLQFDNGIISIRRVVGTYRVRSKIIGDPLEGKVIEVCHPHRLREEYVDWHYRYWFG